MKRGRVLVALVVTVLCAEPAQAAVQLPIPFHKQERTLSCEVATLRMALARYGIAVSENELISRLPFDATSRSPGVWGNPHHGFVGDIDGSMLGSGYGVYATPLAKLGTRWARSEALHGATLEDMLTHVAARRAVIVWGYYGSGNRVQWRDTAGTIVQAVDGEHTRIITGFSGSTQKPEEIYMIDPLSGAETWSANRFRENWAVLGNMAVVVYPQPQWVKTSDSPKVWEISKDGTTRQWVRTWRTFIARGGQMDHVRIISDSELDRYVLGSIIEQ